jgi:Protein of unknown function (DUF2459)
MGVPDEAAERRGKLKRPRAFAFALACAAFLIFLYAPLPAPNVARPNAGDCLELHLWSNGYHSDIGAPAALFPADHPLRRLYPEAREFLIGWGEERFYYSDGRDLWLGVDALIPPSPTVLHIAFDAAAASAYLGPNDDLAIPISSEGAARFVAFVDSALVLDEAGAAIVTAPGKYTGRSAFVRSRGSFHLFNVCNHWMARALRAAGVDVNARAAWFAEPLIAQARRANAATTCAPSRPIMGP